MIKTMNNALEIATDNPLRLGLKPTDRIKVLRRAIAEDEAEYDVSYTLSSGGSTIQVWGIHQGGQRRRL